MRIILDGVFNHSGTQLLRVPGPAEERARSRYADWFRINEWNDDGTFDYEGWFGHAGAARAGADEDDLAKPVRDYIFDITRRWMDPDGDGDPSDGVDGWRLDVAFCVPHGFWKSWRAHVKSINPRGLH